MAGMEVRLMDWEEGKFRFTGKRYPMCHKIWVFEEPLILVDSLFAEAETCGAKFGNYLNIYFSYKKARHLVGNQLTFHIKQGNINPEANRMKLSLFIAVLLVCFLELSLAAPQPGEEGPMGAPWEGLSSLIGCEWKCGWTGCSLKC